MKTEPILYSLTPADPAGHRFRVVLRVPQPNPQGQELTLPAWIPGSYLVRDFSRQIESIAAHCNGKPVAIRKTGNHSWQCNPCQGELQVEYTVYAWDLSVRSAHLDETHGFFNGTSVFLAPGGHEQTPCLLHLHPPAHTRSWKVYTSLPEAADHPQAAKRHGFGVYAAPNHDALIDHPVEMGTPQVASFSAHGAEHELVFTGVIPNLDLKRITADVKKICEAQISLFEPETFQAPFLDSSNRYVFMTMVVGDGYGGLEHRASTALMASRHDLPTLGGAEPGENYDNFLGLVSHEYFHTWNVKRIKPAAFAPYDLARENHTSLLWVFEGFTSYYDELMLLRAGVIDRKTYFARLGKVIAAVHRGPGRLKQSVAQSSFDAWTRFYKQDENSPNALVSYYSKGSLVAAGLDMLIRRESKNQKSLDDVMRLMWSRYGKDFYQGRGQGVPEDAMAPLVLEATGVDVGEFIERYAHGTEDVPLESLLADQGVALTWKAPSKTPSLEVRTRNVNDEVHLATVYEGGAAHKAGLSAGDVLVAINGLRVTRDYTPERLLAAYRPGEEVSIHVFRRDELRKFKAVLAEPARSECILSFETQA